MPMIGAPLFGWRQGWMWECGGDGGSLLRFIIAAWAHVRIHGTLKYTAAGFRLQLSVLVRYAKHITAASQQKTSRPIHLFAKRSPPSSRPPSSSTTTAYFHSTPIGFLPTLGMCGSILSRLRLCMELVRPRPLSPLREVL